MEEYNLAKGIMVENSHMLELVTLYRAAGTSHRPE